MTSFSYKLILTITTQEFSIEIKKVNFFIFSQKMFTRLTVFFIFSSLVCGFSTSKKVPDAVNYYPKTIGYITWR